MSFESPVSFVEKLIKNKKFRDAFVFEQVKTGIPYQMRAIRKKLKWTQGDMGEAIGKPRNVVNRLENPNYGKLTLTTLFEIASGCDMALLVKFVPFSRLLKEYEDVSLEALSVPSVRDKAEIKMLQRWASRKTASEAEPTVATLPQSTEPLSRLMPEISGQSVFRNMLVPGQPANVLPFEDRQRQQGRGNESLSRAGSLSSDLVNEPRKRRVG